MIEVGGKNFGITICWNEAMNEVLKFVRISVRKGSADAPDPGERQILGPKRSAKGLPLRGSLLALLLRSFNFISNKR